MKRVGETIFYDMNGFQEQGRARVFLRVPTHYFAAHERLLLELVSSLRFPRGPQDHELYPTSTPIPQVLLDDPDAQTGAPWQEYVNRRFGYVVRFPAEWPTGQETINASGEPLYQGNPEIFIAVGGILDQYDPAFEAPVSGTQPISITLDSGQVADLFVWHGDGMVVYKVVVVHKAEIWHFYARMPEEWYTAHADIIERVAKGMRRLP
jgi:hypothetical protein